MSTKINQFMMHNKGWTPIVVSSISVIGAVLFLYFGITGQESACQWGLCTSGTILAILGVAVAAVKFKHHKQQCQDEAFASQIFQPIDLKKLASDLNKGENELLEMTAFDFDLFVQRRGKGRFIAIKIEAGKNIQKAHKAYQKNRCDDEYHYLSGSFGNMLMKDVIDKHHLFYESALKLRVN